MLSYLFACGVFWTAIEGTDVNLFVSPVGSDSNKGLSTAHPLKTLSKAVTRLHDADIRGKSVFIELLRGYHDLTQTVTFSHDHGHPITIRSHNGQEVHVTGGKQIGTQAFHPVSDPHVLQKIPSSAHGKVRQARFSDVGISLAQLGHLERFGFKTKRNAPLEIFYNGKPLRLARWPNDGSYVDVVTTPDGQHGHRFTYPSSLGTRPDKWKNESDLWVYGYWYWGWADDSAHVANLDTAHRTMTLDTTLHYGMRPGRVEPGASAGGQQQGGYFNVFNALSELDEEGEYYVDKTAGILYVWPPEHSGTISSADVIYGSIINTLFSFSHVSNITLQDVVLENCRHMAIQGDHLEEVTFEKLEIRNTGSFGMQITHSTSINIRQCNIHDGDGGIIINGGDRKQLTQSKNIIENNHIWEFSRAGAVGQHGIVVGGVGGMVRFNHIHHGRYTAIWWSGNDNVITRNHVHHMCTGSSDCGGIHSGRDWTWRGNVISENHIHHVLRYFPGSQVRGIMLDDQYSSVTIEKNVFHDNELHLNIGGGRDNIVRYNVFYNSTATAIGVDGRGLGHSSNAGVLFDGLKTVPYTNSLWSQKYPKLANITNDEPNAPKGNQIYKNVFYSGSSLRKIQYLGHVHKAEYYDVTDNYMYATVGDFNDPSEGDYRVICAAASWVTKHSFPQSHTERDVGPQLPYGPTFTHAAIHAKNIHAIRHDCDLSTTAPTSHIPRSPVINDGTKPNTKTPIYGCWLITAGCPNSPHVVGSHRDTEGEQHHHALESESACLSRAAVQWKACGSPHDHTVTAVYGPTGAETVAGEGCFMADFGCPSHGSNHSGSIHRDSYAESHEGAAHNEKKCLSRAVPESIYCGSKPDFPVVSIYRPTGAIRIAGYGCWIKLTKCPRDTTLKTMFFDAWGDTNRGTGAEEDICFERAYDFWHHCGSVHTYPVTAIYRPHGTSSTVPPP